MPKFNRVSLSGSDELFRPTRVEDQEEEAVEAAPADTFAGRAVQPPRAPTPAPLSRERNYVRLQMTEDQVQVLIDALQRMKFPHMAAAAHQPSVEEFEALEALRTILLDAVE
jgi:hypothetical protein